MSLLSRTLIVAASGAALAGPLSAQKGASRIFGTVVDRATQGPVLFADIIHAGDGRVVRSDSLGYYQFHDLAAGLVRFTVRARGFPLTTFTVALTNDERMERDIELDSLAAAAAPAGSAQSLPGVTVEAAPSAGARYREFETRKSLGRGQYLTRVQIEQRGSSNLQDLMRGLRGVLVECGGGKGCYIRMARAPMRCLPEYVIDERVDNFFGPNTPIRDIEGIEVYTGPSEVPGEFGGSNAACGVIVIWTKSGPPRRGSGGGVL